MSKKKKVVKIILEPKAPAKLTVQQLEARTRAEKRAASWSPTHIKRKTHFLTGKVDPRGKGS